MDWTWRVGALRPGAENVDWSHAGTRPEWTAARAEAIRVLRELVAREGRQEYRIEIGDVEGVVHPGLRPDGTVDLDQLGESLPPVRY